MAAWATARFMSSCVMLILILSLVFVLQWAIIAGIGAFRNRNPFCCGQNPATLAH
jgi:hypothetical protein